MDKRRDVHEEAGRTLVPGLRAAYGSGRVPPDLLASIERALDTAQTQRKREWVVRHVGWSRTIGLGLAAVVVVAGGVGLSTLLGSHPHTGSAPVLPSHHRHAKTAPESGGSSGIGLPVRVSSGYNPSGKLRVRLTYEKAPADAEVPKTTGNDFSKLGLPTIFWHHRRFIRVPCLAAGGLQPNNGLQSQCFILKAAPRNLSHLRVHVVWGFKDSYRLSSPRAYKSRFLPGRSPGSTLTLTTSVPVRRRTTGVPTSGVAAY